MSPTIGQYHGIHTTAPIIAKEPSGPGALPGFGTVCYDCGLRMSNLFRLNVEADVRQHVAYWLARTAR